MSPLIARRRFLQWGTSLCAAYWESAVAAQPGRTPQTPVVIAQIADTSSSQVDISKDFLVGSRVAWQEINASGGLRGRRVQHVTLEVDGSTTSLHSAVLQARDNPGCVALSGTCAAAAANDVAQMLRHDGIALAHAAPWLQRSQDAGDDQTFAIFANRQGQIRHALRSMASMGVRQLGVVYASAADEALHQRDVISEWATHEGLRMQVYRANGDLRALGQSLSAATPAILLFMGGTPELVRLTQGLENQARQRYVIGGADINLQTLAQMGAARHTPVIATQPVPMVNAQIPLVRQYRQALSRLFDEPPTPQSLAGFVAARYTYEVLHTIEAPLTRANVLAAFARRQTLDLGGLRVSPQLALQFDAFVTQSMLASDGRVIG